MAGEVEKSDEDLRHEGRLEVLEWLRRYEIVNYSIPEDVYFMNFPGQVLVIPWRKETEDVG